VPDDPGEGCGEAATTDPADLGVGRTLARCEPGEPAAVPLASPVDVRVAVSERTESAAPVLLADAMGEFEAENLTVELVEMPQGEAYAAMAAGDVDAVVGGIDAPFFDAVHGGTEARLVIGGPVARAPSDLEMAQTGLWLRADLISDDGEWDNVETQTVLVGGTGSSAIYPVEAILSQESLGGNSVDFVPATADAAADRLMNAQVGAAWLPEPAAARVADDEALRLVATLPGSESIEGTVLSPRLLGADRAVGLALTRAIIRTVNTHLADSYDDEALAALSEALDVPEDALAAGPTPLFDWEVRAGTTTRIQEALIEVGAVRYERVIGERGLVDRTVSVDALAPGDADSSSP
jgi:NitT/TauT family transport system substrate-binding protein